jgi:5,10-methenyltetrahydrofolate synthetase
VNSTPSAASPADDLAAWRQQARAELIARRMSAGAADRQRWSEAIARHLDQLLPIADARAIGFCWPYKGEPDVLPVVRRWVANGGTAALPVVLKPRSPMVFRRWAPDVAMTTGVYDIPVPRDTELLHPDILLIPLTGFDDTGYRLGYGGGFFDRTVITLDPRPLMIGVGFELSRMASIRPQSHDQPMDLIVTELGVHRHRRPD